MSRVIFRARVFLPVLLALTVAFAQGQESFQSKIRAAQNPIADRTFLGLQNFTGFGLGPQSRVNNVLDIIFVYAFPLGSSWNLTSRLVTPLVYEPNVFFPQGGNFGLGDIGASFYFNRNTDGPYTWGIGPTFLFPTSSSDFIGADKWVFGVSVVAEYNQDNWLAGLLLSNIWSYAGLQDRSDINLLTIEPFVNYIIPNTNGLTLVTSPAITADWSVSYEHWTVPLGGGLGYLVQFGEWSTFLTLQGYINVISPQYSPDWNLVVTAQLLFPESAEE